MQGGGVRVQVILSVFTVLSYGMVSVCIVILSAV